MDEWQGSCGSKFAARIVTTSLYSLLSDSNTLIYKLNTMEQFFHVSKQLLCLMIFHWDEKIGKDFTIVTIRQWNDIKSLTQ